MTVMVEDVIASAPAGVVLEVLLLHRLPAWLRALLGCALLATCAAVAQLSLTAQHHFATAGNTDRISVLLARGSTVVTAWPGWVAAVFFAIAVVRLRRGATEPPAGRTPVERLNPTQIRRALVREYTVVRVALLLVGLVAILDLARASRYVIAAASDDRLAGSTLPATVVEAVGLAVAAAVLLVWALSFRAQLEQVGAIR